MYASEKNRTDLTKTKALKTSFFNFCLGPTLSFSVALTKIPSRSVKE